MAFDLTKFVRLHRRVWEQYGDELIVACPSCDHGVGAHLWINVAKGKGICYRCRHVMASELDVVIGLSGLSLHEAHAMLRAHRTPQTDFHAAVAQLATPRVVPRGDGASEVDLPNEFDLIQNPDDIPPYALGRKIGIRTCRRWGLGVCDSGRYANRLIVPVLDTQGRLRSFVARAMGPGHPKVLYPKGSQTSHILFSESYAWQHNTVVVTEGVFDVMRVGRMAVALFGKVASLTQRGRLTALANRRRIVIMLDRDAEDDARALADQLAPKCPDVRIATIPSGYSDPGDTPRKKLATAVAAARRVRPRSAARPSFRDHVRALYATLHKEF